MLGTPLGLLLSLIGLLFDKKKAPAILGLVLGGAVVLLFFIVAMCR